jgi:hypothetical protein
VDDLQNYHLPSGGTRGRSYAHDPTLTAKELKQLIPELEDMKVRPIH